MIEDELTRSVAAWYPGATGVAGTLKLSGGASQETWSFEIMTPSGNVDAILRRAPKGYGAAPSRAAGTRCRGGVDAARSPGRSAVAARAACA